MVEKHLSFFYYGTGLYVDGVGAESTSLPIDVVGWAVDNRASSNSIEEELSSGTGVGVLSPLGSTGVN